ILAQAASAPRPIATSEPAIEPAAPDEPPAPAAPSQSIQPAAISQDAPTLQPPHEDPAPPAIKVGTLLCNRYLLVRLLGSGGSSLIFEAEDRHHQGPPDAGSRVAIKVLREEMQANPHALTRLRREFRQMRRLEHPGIARVFDLANDEGVWF